MAGRPLYYWDFENSLKRGKLAPIYAFLGEETFLKQRALGKLRKAVLPEGADPLNCQVAYADEAPVGRFLDEARTFPFLGGRRFMVLKNVEGCVEKDLQALDAYQKHPAECTVLVLEYGSAFDPNARENKTKKALKPALELPEHYLFLRMKADSLLRFLDAYVTEQGYRVERPSLELLADRLDGDLDTITHELEKLHLAADGGPIRKADVEQAAARHHKTNIFEMIASLAARDASGALGRLAYMLEAGEPHLIILLMIGRFYQQALGYLSLAAGGAPEAEIVSRLKMAPYQVRPVKTASCNYTIPELRDCLAAVGKWEEQFKSVHIDADHHLELLLVRLCRRGA